MNRAMVGHNVTRIKSLLLGFLLSLCSLAFFIQAFAQSTASLKVYADAGDDLTVSIGEVVTLSGIDSTINLDKDLYYLWYFASKPAASNADFDNPTTVRPLFTVDQLGDYEIRLCVKRKEIKDADDCDDTDSLIISTSNSDPVAVSPRDRVVNTGESFVLDGRESYDFDGDHLIYSWSLVHTPNGSNIQYQDIRDPAAIFSIDTDGEFVFALKVSDDNGASWSAPSYTGVVSGNNEDVNPAVFAGPDQTAVIGEHVWFDADNTLDDNGDKLGSEWLLVFAPDQSQSAITHKFHRGYDRSRPSTSLDVDGDYVVQLGVKTNHGHAGFPETWALREQYRQKMRGYDTLLVTTGNVPPVANAGEDELSQIGEEVILDGSRSTDVNGNLLSFRWSIISMPIGSSASVSGEPGPVNVFTPDIEGEYVAQLLVNDGTQWSSADHKIIKTQTQPRPIANAGLDVTMSPGESITLSAGASQDPLGEGLSFQWNAIWAGGSNLANWGSLTGASTSNPTFTFSSSCISCTDGSNDPSGYILVQLKVTDGLGRESFDIVVISLTNSRPVAVPNVLVGADDELTIDGLSSIDADGDPMTYAWSLLYAPQDSVSAIEASDSANPVFVPDTPGWYVLQLIVNDGELDSYPKTVLIEGPPPNEAPIAVAGDDFEIFVGQQANLDGSLSSDPEGQALTYLWSLVTQPENSLAEITNSTNVDAFFVPDVRGDYSASLVVNDGEKNSSPDYVAITVPNRAPDATATVSTGIHRVGSQMMLIGTGADSDNDELTFSWSILSAPSGSGAAIDNPDVPTTNFTPDLQGQYQFELSVSDGIETALATAVTNVLPPMTAPELLPIGDYSLYPGETLQFVASATDASGLPIRYTISPLPMPEGASLDGQTGAFLFTPKGSQAGSVYGFTLYASNGIYVASEAFTVTVRHPETSGITNIIGKVYDAEATNIPVVGASVMIDGQTVTTDANGAFTANVSSIGNRVFFVDGAAAALAPDGSVYSTFTGVRLIEDKVVNDVGSIWLPRLGDTVEVEANSATEINETDSDVTLTVPGGAIAPGTLLSVNPVPVAELGDVTDLGFATCQMQSLEPARAVFSSPVLVTSPNHDNLPAGSRVRLLSLDPLSGSFMAAGVGQVTADGSRIETISGGLTSGGSFIFLPMSLENGRSSGQLDDIRLSSLFGNGSVRTEITLPSYQSVGETRMAGLVYTSISADPTGTLTAEVTLSPDGGLPEFIETRVYIGGVLMGENNVDLAQGLDGSGPLDPSVMPTISIPVIFDAATLPTGRYDYEMSSIAHYPCSKTIHSFSGKTLIENNVDSPYGDGWTVKDLPRLYPQQDGSVVLTDGSGNIKAFDVDPNIVDSTEFTDLSDIVLDDAALNANQTPVQVDGSTVLRLTDGYNQKSSAFYKDSFPLSVNGRPASFNTAFSFQFTNGGGIGDPGGGITGADGMVFTIAPSNSNLGSFGGGLGYSGVDNSFGVEFDTYRNSSFGDLDGNHVGVNVGGNINSLEQVNVGQNFNDGQIWYAWIDYNGESELLEVFVRSGLEEKPIAPIISREINIAEATGLSEGFFGFTAGTGAAKNDQDVRSWSLQIESSVSETATFISPSGDFSTLSQNANGEFIRVMKDGIVSVFNSDGTLQSMTDRNGNSTSYSYDDDGVILTMTDPAGLVTVWTYTNGVLASITDPSGRQTTFEIGPDGRLVTVQQPEQYITNFTYDERSRLTSEIDARSFATSHSYDGFGNYSGTTAPDGTSVSVQIAESVGLPDIISGLGSEAQLNPYLTPSRETMVLTDMLERPSTITVNEYGSIVEITDPIGRTTRMARNEHNIVNFIEFESNADGAIAKIPEDSLPPGIRYLFQPQWDDFSPYSYFQDGSGGGGSLGVAEYYYVQAFVDESGNIIKLITGATNPGTARETLYTYDPEYNLITNITDALGRSTNWSYDANGNLLSMVDADGNETLYTYDSRGLRISMTDPLGRVTTYTHDGLGRLETITNPIGAVTRLGRDDAGNIVLEIEAEGTAEEHRTVTVYDAQNRPTRVIDSTGGVEQFGYDEEGNLFGYIDPTGVLYERVFDTNGRVVEERDPAIGTVTYAYDAAGNLTLQTLSDGREITMTYDDADRLVSTTDPEGFIRRLGYDPQDNIVSVTDAQNNTTTYTFDVHSRAISRTNPAGEVYTATYDNVDNMLQATDPKGQTFSYDYDPLDRLLGITTPDDVYSYSYDAVGNLLSANDNDSTLSFIYDDRDRIKSELTGGTVQPAVTLTHTYDLLDRRLSMSDSDGRLTNRAYDRENRLTSLTGAANDTLTFGYDPAGRKTSANLPGGVSMSSGFDTTTGLRGSLAVTSGTGALESFDYDYDGTGRIERIDEASRTRHYAHSAVNRLTSVLDGLGADENYVYDGEGNRTGSHRSSAYIVNAANRVLETDSHSYTYDANGNRISQTDRTSGIVTAYTYDSFDRLIGVGYPGVATAGYAYDALGRRIAKTVTDAGNALTTSFIYDGPDITLEYANDNQGAGPAFTARYDHGQYDDEPLIMERATGNALPDGTPETARYLMHADHLGSIRRVTSASDGSTVNAYDYDSFGNRTVITETVPQPYGFTGREWDAESGLYHYRARAYDPVIARFIQDDPIGFAGGDLNLSAYVWSDPLHWTDPTGLTAASENANLTQPTAGVASTGAIPAISQKIVCIFSTVAAVLSVAEEQPAAGFVLEGVSIVSCGAKGTWKKRKTKCPPNKCFAAGTLIQTADGLKPIEDIEAGDRVKSMDEVTGEIGFKPVTETHINTFDPVGLVSLEDGADGSALHLQVTAQHPFFSAERGWVDAGDLRAGERIFASEADAVQAMSAGLIPDMGSEPPGVTGSDVLHVSRAANDNASHLDVGVITVTSVTFDPLATPTRTYNFEVADWHTYFVGEDGVLVHNGKPCKCRKFLKELAFVIGGALGAQTADDGLEPPANVFEERERRRELRGSSPKKEPKSLSGSGGKGKGLTRGKGRLPKNCYTDYTKL